MKKRFCLLLGIITVITALTLSSFGCAPEETTTLHKFTVMSDIHLLSSQQYGDTVTACLQQNMDNNEKVVGLTEAIFRTAIDEFIASDSPYLILTGDLSDDGAKVAHEEVARQLARAEKAGKQCFVINGNHDINNRSKSYKQEKTVSIENIDEKDFAEIYADFGYNEALVRDEKTLSYTAELGDKYRLIAVDVAHYFVEEDGTVEGRHQPDVTDDLLEWVDEQLYTCRKDGKEPFVITHFPVLSHVGDLFGSYTYINKQERFLSLLEDYAVSFSFCGHVHQQDIATYVSGDYTYYDIETGSLTFTTLPVRTFLDDGEKIEISTKSITHIDPSYIPSFYSEEERKAITENLNQYVLEYENSVFGRHYFEKLYWDDILALFGVGADENGTALAVDAYNMASDYFYMPLYQGEKCLKTVCSTYGITIPVVDDCDDICSLVVYFVKKNFSGDECITSTDEHITLLKYAVYAAVQALSDFSMTSRIHDCYSGISAYDISAALPVLFTEGKLEVVENGLLGILGEIPKIVSLLNKIPVLKNVISTDAEDNADNIKTLLDSVIEGNLLDVFNLPSLQKYLDIILKDGYTPYLDYSEFEQGKMYINLNGLLDMFIENFTAGLLTDEGAPDNNFSFTLQVYGE